MKKNRNVSAGKLKFRTKCGVEFEATTFRDSNWQGLIRVGRKPADPNSDPELVKKFEADKGVSANCVRCTLGATLKEEYKNVCKHGDFNNMFGVLETYCVADLVEKPYPDVCPITGDKFERLAFDMDANEGDGRVIPVYKDKDGNMHTDLWLEISFGELRFMYRVIKGIDEDSLVDFEWGACIYDKTKESILSDLKDILDGVDKDSVVFVKAKHLYNVFHKLNFSEDGEDDEGDEKSED